MKSLRGKMMAVFVGTILIGSLLTVRAARQQTATTQIVTAAKAFLSTLDASQRQKVLYAFDDQDQRKRWSNLPTTMVLRGGIALKDMTPAQQTAAMALVAAVLSKRGFEKVQEIMQGDEVNKLTDTGPGRGNRGSPPGANRGGPPPDGNGSNPPPLANGRGRGPGGGGAMFGKDLYYISILGTPSEKDPWMLQFGGHHLALNVTMAGDRGVLTPTLTGAQPALYMNNGKTVRPLGEESDKALALLNALSDDQRKQAILSYQVADLVLGPGQDGQTIQPEGLKASAMNDQQRAMLLDVMSEWADIINERDAATRMAQLKSEMNESWFAWSGPTTAVPGKNITAYYRIQGPHVVIEYAPQSLGGDLSMHVHTMYRDPTNDYGKGLLGTK